MHEIYIHAERKQHLYILCRPFHSQVFFFLLPSDCTYVAAVFICSQPNVTSLDSVKRNNFRIWCICIEKEKSLVKWAATAGMNVQLRRNPNGNSKKTSPLCDWHLIFVKCTVKKVSDHSWLSINRRETGKAAIKTFLGLNEVSNESETGFIPK